MSWEPKRGERVIAVLSDGHEIEGKYSHVDRCSDPERHCVTLDTEEVLYVLTVKPVPVEEPKTFGACVKDRYGVRWVRDGGVDWLDANNNDRTWRTLSEVRGPITVVNADPWGES